VQAGLETRIAGTLNVAVSARLMYCRPIQSIRAFRAYYPRARTMSLALRFLASVLLLIAVIAIVSDATRSLAAHTLTFTSLGEHWAKIAPATLTAARSAVQRHTHPLVWDLGIRKLLLLPTWVVFGVLGMLVAYTGRQRRRVNVFAN
jgi:hypothetical protein